MNTLKDKQIQNLLDCIIKSIEGSDFKWEIFFKLWFRDRGTPLFFLFKKNLSVTNLQFVELFSLITKYSNKSFIIENSSKLLFYNTEHIKNTTSEILNSLLEDYKTDDTSKLKSFCETYVDIISSSVAVDMFFGSCAIFLPPGISTDIESIVSDSGYIHSAGKSLLIRNINKAKKRDLFNSLYEYIKKDKKVLDIPFVVYSHEDFSDYDKESSDLINKGIEQCKIYVEKMSMGSFKLSTIISEIQNDNKLKGRILIPGAGNYQKVHNFKQEKTLWLIADRSLSTGQIRNPGQSRYYICYEQTYKNDSPFFFFDENKPAWKSHTTMPHSLTASLVNTALPANFNGVVCDPFGGTGTTWIEIKRLQIPCTVYSSDLSPSAKRLLLDNIEFFTMGYDEINNILKDLMLFHQQKEYDAQFQINFLDINLPIVDPHNAYSDAVGLLNRLKKSQKHEEQEFNLSKSFIADLEKQSIIVRILFYVALRAQLRFQESFKRKSLNFEEAFNKSLEKLIDQTKMLVEIKLDVLKEFKSSIPVNKSYVSFKGTYSQKLTPSFIFKDKNTFINQAVKEVSSAKDARDLKPNSIDVIICDPPYSLNKTEEGLLSLYSEFIDKAIAALKTRGQLLMCLPAESYTGHVLPFCTRQDLISRQIITKAHDQGRYVYQAAQSIPNQAFQPPYYWEADRALRRTIIHFRFL
ncbi:hypothetical protein [Larkinella rosea]|uniref:Ribosomal RNA large subunit methyltransferase K/L-like methyltransferase domain-containing protein n=1 Tax=Larkinella rosea TaxID=2025312 RepID=A0A3P1C0D3_9BACT|nr:hypothetical protein [Larkinella rosea]RRB06861.1 hypothetical protein EHT25_03475 [Larkinella rosea]